MNAHEYALLGWSVIPLKPRNKKPALNSWLQYQRHHATHDQLLEWFDDTHNNHGIVTGAVSGIIVLDADGPEGIASLIGMGMPSTPTVKTGNGFHLYFKHPGGNVSNSVRMQPGLDLRADGGYVVAPPSVHPDGTRYEWQTPPSDAPLAPPPEWLVQIIERNRAGASATDWDELADRDIVQGERDSTIARVAGLLFRKDIPPRLAFRLLRSLNETGCKPPLSEADVKRVCRSVYQREQQRRAS